MKTSGQKRKFWKNHWKQWHSSPMTQVEYCRMAGVSVHIFRKYSGTFSKEIKKQVDKPPGFFLVPENKLPVKPNKRKTINASAGTMKLKLQLPDKMSLEIPDGFNPETLFTIQELKS